MYPKKILFAFFFCIFLSGIFCETQITSELQAILEEAYYNVTCTNKDANTCTTLAPLYFKNNTEQLQVDWLCRDEDIISFNWTSNNRSIYVIEYRSGYENWTYYEQTMQNIAVLEYLEYDEEYQIRIWKVSLDGSFEGPFVSDKIRTLHPEYYPLDIPTFKLVNWEYQDGSSFFANVEWTPAKDRLCFYSITSDDEQIIHITSDFNDVFKEKIPGFTSGKSYDLRIAPKMSNSFVKNDGTYITVVTPKCMDLYKSVDMCLPIIPGGIQINETISKYYKHSFENLTYDVNITWSDPEYKPDNYTISIAILKHDYPKVTQNATGNATGVMFYNVTLTPHYTMSIMMSSKAGHTKHSFSRMFSVNPNSFKVPDEPFNAGFIIIWACTSIVLAIISLISFICYRRYEKSKIEDITILKNIHQRQFKIVDDQWNLNSNDIEVGDVIGEGVFGIVFQGRRKNEDVAIKMLKGNYTSDEVRQFEQEIDIMKSVGYHPNVVSLLGFCLKPEYSCPLLIVEYCKMGNLQTHLRSLWTEITATQQEQREYVNISNKQFSNLEYNFPEITDLSKIMLSYALQIASGMEHLSKNKVIHRDLATRNILRFSNQLVKVSDFGLSRDVYLDSTYTKTGSGVLPVKWMAIESFTHQIFSSQSDVWSFGVLLWEIATFAENPYSDISHENLLTFLRNGQRLHRPESCHLKIYQIMLKCWKQNPQERPTFTELVQNLEELLQSNNRYLFINNIFDKKEEFL